MGAVKKAFEDIGHGIVHVAEGIGHAVKGLGETVAGALTANPQEMKAGLGDIKGGVEQSISGAGEVAGGVVSAAIDVTPIGAAINGLTGGDGVNKFVDGVANNISGTLNGGIEGVVDIGKGIATGNLREIGSGLLGVGMAAALVIPGEGEIAAGAEAAVKIGEEGADLAASGAAHGAFSEALDVGAKPFSQALDEAKPFSQALDGPALHTAEDAARIGPRARDKALDDIRDAAQDQVLNTASGNPSGTQGPVTLGPTEQMQLMQMQAQMQMMQMMQAVNSQIASMNASPMATASTADDGEDSSAS